MTKLDFEIRQFEPRDLAEVMNINRTCLPENYPSSFFLDMHYSHPELFLVAVSQDSVVGYVMCRVEHGFSEVRRLRLIKKGHIVSIAVLARSRRAGVGARLVAAVLARLISHNADECFLEVRVSNSSAIALYGSIGFKEGRHIPYYYKDGEEAIVMYKQVKPSSTAVSQHEIGVRQDSCCASESAT